MERSKFHVSPSGEKHTFNCHAVGDGPIIYAWYKDGLLLQTRRIDSSFNAKQAELVLKDLVLSDIGNYTCKVKNDNDEIEFRFELKVQGISSQLWLIDGFKLRIFWETYMSNFFQMVFPERKIRFNVLVNPLQCLEDIMTDLARTLINI